MYWKTILGLVLLCGSAFADATYSTTDYIYPADIGFFSVKDYGAFGDGVIAGDGSATCPHDDTTAIQNAMAAAHATAHQPDGFRRQTVYFPAGVYCVTRTLYWNTDQTAVNPNWYAYLRFEGQNKANTIIRLKDSTFTNASCTIGGDAWPVCPSVIYTANQTTRQSGWGESAFWDDIWNLTVDTGRLNNGAIGITWQGSNRASMRNVRVISQDNHGKAGVNISTTGLGAGVGPAFAKNVYIKGFDYGVYANGNANQVGVTFEHTDLVDQNIAGAYGGGMPLWFRWVGSNNTVPVFVSCSNTATFGAAHACARSNTGVLVLSDAVFAGGNASTSAILLENPAQPNYIRNVITAGSTYASAIASGNTDAAVAGANVTEYSSITGTSPWGYPLHSLNLSAPDTPELHNQNLGTTAVNANGFSAAGCTQMGAGGSSDWRDVTCFGASKTGSADATASIQSAMNDGKPVLYFPWGQYRIDGILHIPNTTRVLLGNASWITNAVAGVFSCENTTTNSVEIRNFEWINTSGHSPTINNGCKGPLVIADDLGNYGGYEETGTGHTVYFEDHSVPVPASFSGDTVYARQFDPEGGFPTFTNSTAWIFGFKSEQNGARIVTATGGSLEILGADHYCTGCGTPVNPQYSFSGTTASVEGFKDTYTGWNPTIGDVKSGVTKNTTSFILSLYSGNATSLTITAPTFTAPGTGGGGPPPPPNPIPFISDAFSGVSLNQPPWLTNANGTYAVSNGSITISAACCSSHSTGSTVPSVSQTVTDQDFDLATKILSAPIPGAGQGIIFRQDSLNDIFIGELVDAGGFEWFIDTDINGVKAVAFFAHAAPIPTAPFWMRVTRVGNLWTLKWSADGITYSTLGSVTQVFGISSIGLFTYNSSGAGAPAFDGQFGYVADLNATTPDVRPNFTAGKSHTDIFTQGGSGNYLIQTSNAGMTPSSGAVTVSDPMPTGLTATAASGTGWGCSIASNTATCTRSDALGPETAYPPITVVTTISPTASSSVTNTVTVTGGGGAGGSFSDLTNINPSGGTGTITMQGPISVKAGQTALYTFNHNVSVALDGVGTLSCTTNCASVSYTAPSTIPVASNRFGCAQQPPDSIWHTRIDSMPLDANNSGIKATQALNGNVLGFFPEYGMSMIDATTPYYLTAFFYTTSLDTIPWPWPNLPFVQQNGALPETSNNDHHRVSVDQASCTFYETYNSWIDAVAGRSAASGNIYTPTGNGTVGPYDLGLFGGTNAAGMPLLYSLTASDVRNGGHHPLGFTMATGYNFSGPGFSAFHWPATSGNGSGDGSFCFGGNSANCLQMGSWMRLSAAWCTANLGSYSALAQNIITQLCQYGAIDIDNGGTMTFTTDLDVNQDQAVMDAIAEVSSTIPNTAWEFIDASSLMIGPNSTRVNPSNGHVTITNHAVITASDGTNTPVTQAIALQPVTIGMKETYFNIAAGTFQTSGYQLAWWVNGSTNQGVTWTHVSGPGTVTSGGSYKPPATSGSIQQDILLGTPAGDTNSTLKVYATVFPQGTGVRVDSGAHSSTTDSHGKLWLADVLVQQSGNQHNNSDHGLDASWGSTTPDSFVWQTHTGSFGDDATWGPFILPNGNYQITFYVSKGECTGSWDSITTTFDTQLGIGPLEYEANGHLGAYFNTGQTTGYLCRIPASVSIPATVTDNRLLVSQRSTGPIRTGTNYISFVSGMEIEPDATSAHLSIVPRDVTTVYPSGTLRLDSVPWYFEDAGTVWEILQGPGTVDATGLYTAPSSLPKTAYTTVRATNNGFTASVRLLVSGTGGASWKP